MKVTEARPLDFYTRLVGKKMLLLIIFSLCRLCYCEGYLFSFRFFFSPYLRFELKCNDIFVDKIKKEERFVGANVQFFPGHELATAQ